MGDQQGVAVDSLKYADGPDDLSTTVDKEPRNTMLVVYERHKGNATPLKERWTGII